MGSAAGLATTVWTAAEVVAPLAIACLYLGRARTLAREGRPVAPSRQMCFASGLVIVAAATITPLETLADQLVVAHMVQHLLLADIASLLFVLGLTGPVMQPLLANRSLRPLRRLSHPVVAITLFTLVLYVWHLPPLYQAAVRSTPVHVLEHFSFIFFGVFMWMPLFGPLPQPAWFGRGGHIAYTGALFVTAMAMANLFLWSPSAFYPDYAAAEHTRGMSPLTDQSAAGGVLMIWCMFMAVGLFVVVFLRWTRTDEERQELEDLAHAHGVALAAGRVARAVQAGAAAGLRERIELAGPKSGPGLPTREPDQRRNQRGGSVTGEARSGSHEV